MQDDISQFKDYTTIEEKLINKEIIKEIWDSLTELEYNITILTLAGFDISYISKKVNKSKNIVAHVRMRIREKGKKIKNGQVIKKIKPKPRLKTPIKKEDVNSILDSLDMLEHTIIILYLDDFNNDDIAKNLNLSKSQVENAIYRVRRKVKNKYNN